MQSKQQEQERTREAIKLGRQCEQLNDADDKETAVKGDVSQHLSPPIEVRRRGDKSSYGVRD